MPGISEVKETNTRTEKFDVLRRLTYTVRVFYFAEKKGVKKADITAILSVKRDLIKGTT